MHTEENAISLMEMTQNKNAFQWDAYCPFVDHIPARTGQGGVSAQGGVCPGGGYILACTGQGGVYPSMHWAGSVCPGGCLQGVSAPGGFCPGVYGRHPPWTDRHL